MIVVLFAALPTASSAYVLAACMGGDDAYVAGLVPVSTLLGLVSVPLWLAVLFRSFYVRGGQHYGHSSRLACRPLCCQPWPERQLLTAAHRRPGDCGDLGLAAGAGAADGPPQVRGRSGSA